MLLSEVGMATASRSGRKKRFKDGFPMQTGSGAASTAATRFLEERMARKGIKASFALGGITGSIAELHKKGLIQNNVFEPLMLHWTKGLDVADLLSDQAAKAR
jgi:citrate lyase alpha subunit